MLAVHAFNPVYDEHSAFLILGTMPSPQSIRHGFYYSHPQNRFWPLLAELYAENCPSSPEEKAAFALRHKIALWDVLAQCEINGASDASIRKPVTNDIGIILQAAPIRQIYTTGKTAYRLYQRYLEPKIQRQAVYLPSTSPANQAMYPWPILVNAWRNALEINAADKIVMAKSNG